MNGSRDPRILEDLAEETLAAFVADLGGKRHEFAICELSAAEGFVLVARQALAGAPTGSYRRVELGSIGATMVGLIGGLMTARNRTSVHPALGHMQRFRGVLACWRCLPESDRASVIVLLHKQPRTGALDAARALLIAAADTVTR